MKIECVIDNRMIKGEYNPQLPLSWLIREEFAEEKLKFFDCENKNCSHCLIIIKKNNPKKSDILSLSCLVPIFRINGKKIITSSEFEKTEEAEDILDSYKMLKIRPCKHCFNKKSMIFSYIADTLIEMEKVNKKGSKINERCEYIKNSLLSLSSCKCLLMEDMRQIIEMSIKIRRNKIV